MITYKDIRSAINDVLLSRFDIPIQSTDVKEGFERPSFFIQLEAEPRRNTETQYHRALTVRIYYFPTDRYDFSIELLEKQDQLEAIFDLKLNIKDRYLNIDNPVSRVTDGVLNFSFEIEFFEGRDTPYYVGENPNAEMMESLDIDIRKE